MYTKHSSILVVAPGGLLRGAMESLQERFDYFVRVAEDPFVASNLIDNTNFDALIFEVTPPYTAESRLMREICGRPGHLPVVLFAGPEDEEYVLDELAQGGFNVVRWTAPLDEFHRAIHHSIERHRVRTA